MRKCRKQRLVALLENDDHEEFPSEHKSSSNGRRGVAPANHFKSRKSGRYCVHLLEKESTTSRSAKVWVGFLPRHTCAHYDDLCSSRTGG